MPDYKRQHWVPQSYLRRFSPDGTHVWMFDKPTGRVAFPNVRDVAQGRYFNDGFLRDDAGATPEDVPPGLIEQAFGKWEDALAQVTDVARGVAAGRGAGLQERQTMATCVAVQLARTAAFRKHLETIVTAALEEDLNTYLAERMPKFATQNRAVLTLPPEWSSFLHAEYMWQSGDVAGMAADLYRYIWRVGVNESGTPFCTSDTPVTGFVHDAAERCGRGAAGSRHRDGVAGAALDREDDVVRRVLLGAQPARGLEVIFPVTPRVILLMYHPDHFAHMRQAQGRRMALRLGEVLHYNALQLLNAERQAYASTDLFGLVRKHAAMYRDVTDERPAA